MIRNELMPLEEMKGLAEVFVKSKFFADSQDVNQAIVKILAGRELGFPPIASMTGIQIIKGKPSLSANLQAMRVKASGKYDYRLRVHEATNCEIEFFQSVNGTFESIGVSKFTIEDARKAGTQNLDKYPRNMLFARAMSNGVKWFCPDVTNGVIVYTPEEMGAEVTEDGEIVEVEARAPVIHRGPTLDTTPVVEITAPKNGNGSHPEPDPVTPPLPQPIVVPSHAGPPYYGIDPKWFGELSQEPFATQRKNLTVTGANPKTTWYGLLKFATDNGWALGDDGVTVNEYRLARDIWDGGFDQFAVNPDNVEKAKAALVKHCTKKEPVTEPA